MVQGTLVALFPCGLSLELCSVAQAGVVLQTCSAGTIGYIALCAVPESRVTPPCPLPLLRLLRAKIPVLMPNYVPNHNMKAVDKLYSDIAAGSSAECVSHFFVIVVSS
jgi:hypothetical protein